MEGELTMLNILFPGLVSQTSDHSLQYRTDQVVVDFEYPADYPESRFTYKITPAVSDKIKESLNEFTDSTVDFITQLSQQVDLTAKFIAGYQENQFKRAIFDTHTHFHPDSYDNETEFEQQLKDW